jgi:carotenoid 1,2-hydratase
VFSPYYAWANRGGPADPENFCAMNCVLYRRRGGVWAMTERGRRRLARGGDRLSIGPSSLHWDGAALTATIDEVAAPLPRRLRGTIRVTPHAVQPQTFVLDAAGRHRWRPIAPAARVEVAFARPDINWHGHGYFDSNDGDAPLARDFCSWTWSRAATPEGATIFYDVIRRDHSPFSLALSIDATGHAENVAAPPEQNLPGTLWRVARRTRADAGFSPRVLQTLEDAPFYARSKIATRINGAEMEAIHESLSLDRFAQPWVRALLPFRMPRFG